MGQRFIVVAALVLSACTSSADSGVDASQAPDAASVTPTGPAATPAWERTKLDGAYRTRLTEADAVALGLSKSVRDDVADTYWYMSLDFGYLQQHYAHAPGPGFCCDGLIGDFRVNGDRITVIADGLSMTLTWTLSKGQLTMRLVKHEATGMDRAVDEYIFTSSVWRRLPE